MRKKGIRAGLMFAAALALSGCKTMEADRLPVSSPSQFTQAELQRFQNAAIEVLFWNNDQKLANFRQMETLFPGTIAAPAARPRLLPEGTALPIPESEIEAYLTAQNAVGLLVLQDGKIRLERYAFGFGPQDRWTSFSVAKSLTSTLAGVAIKQGKIRSIDDPVTRYLPELAMSGYENVTVRQVLTMSSGVRWDENYADPNSDVARFFAEPVVQGEDPNLTYLARLPSEAAPGTKWNYKTGETNLIGIIVQRATGKSLTRLASETLVPAIGFEGELFWQVDTVGQNVGGCCLSLTMRDYARLGQYALEGGSDILPEGWMADATRKSFDVGAPGAGYGYQWWTFGPQNYGARGIFGQSITVLPQQRVVIVQLSAWPRATDSALSQQRNGMVARVLQAL